MPFWVLPVVFEAVLTLLFCGVLLSLRRSLNPAGLAFWTFVWVARGACTVFVLLYVGPSERQHASVFAPLQLAVGLAIIAIADRLERQKRQLGEMQEEVERLRQLTADHLDTDPLTGLGNRLALERWIAREQDFEGLVVVCDMDDFKPLNDLYGHLVGDEILHGVGKLVRSSIRERDLAFRWGGDEFVIFFENADREVVGSRMRSIEDRLRAFQIRKHGPVTVGISWGIAPASGANLREALAEADRAMYESKRTRTLSSDPQPDEDASPGPRPAAAS